MNKTKAKLSCLYIRLKTGVYALGTLEGESDEKIKDKGFVKGNGLTIYLLE